MTKKIVTLIVAAFFVALPFSSVADAKDVEQPIISVDGSGSAIVSPDEATVSIGVSTNAKDAAEAQRENAARAQAIQNAVKALGIESKDISTRNYSFRPTYRQNENRRNEINGYAVDNTVVVTVHDLELTGKVIDASLKAGANRIHSLDFSATKTHGATKEALLAAINDARDKADIIAKGLGKRIVGVQRVSESVGGLGRRNYKMPMFAMQADMAEAAVATPIEAGELTLNASVHIDFILEN